MTRLYAFGVLKTCGDGHVGEAEGSLVYDITRQRRQLIVQDRRITMPHAPVV